MLKTNPDKWNELETATLDSRNGDKWYKDGLKLRQSQRKVQLKIIKYQKATWLPHQYVKLPVLKDKGHTLPPSPQEGLINPHYHTHGATSPQSPSNLQPSTSPALISACSMGAIPNHSILHPLPTPPPPPPLRRSGSIPREKLFWKEFLTKMLISKGENTEKKEGSVT